MKTPFVFLLPLLLFFGIITLLFSQLRAPGLGGIAHEEAAASLLLARSLTGEGMPGLVQDASPIMTRNSLYVGLLALIVPYADASAVPNILIGVLASLGVLLLLARFTEFLGLTMTRRMTVLGTVALLPSFHVNAVTGTSSALLTLVVTGALVMFIRFHQQHGYGLRLPVLICIALAAAIMPEALLLLALLAAAIWAMDAVQRERAWTVAPVLDGVNGILVCALVLLPVVMYHHHAAGTPWPREPEAWLIAGTAIPSGIGLGSLVADGFRQGMIAFLQAGWGALLLLGAGCISAIHQLVHRRSGTACALLTLLLLTVPLLAAGSLVLGTRGIEPVVQSLVPVLLVLSLYLSFRCLETLVRMNPPAANWLGDERVPMAVIILVSLMNLPTTVGQMQELRATQKELLALRETPGIAQNTVLGTDRPGLAQLLLPGEIVDMTGRYDVRTLVRMGAGGRMSDADWSDLMLEKDPTHWLIWDSDRYNRWTQNGLLNSGAQGPPWFQSRWP